MRILLSLLSFAVLLATSGCGQGSGPLDAGYRAAAEDLRKRMDAALQDNANQSMLLQETHEAEEAFEKASQLADERDGKVHRMTAYLSGKVYLDNISTSPVELKKDDGDPSARYKATVVLTYKTEGQTDSANVAMAVTADPAGKWTFPDTAEALRITREQFGYSASALLERAKY